MSFVAEIEALAPLLEKVGDGVVWVLAVHYGASLFKTAVIAGAAVGIVAAVVRVIDRINMREKEQEAAGRAVMLTATEIGRYVERWTVGDIHMGYGATRQIAPLLAEIGGTGPDGGVISEEQMRAAIAALRDYKTAKAVNAAKAAEGSVA